MDKMLSDRLDQKSRRIPVFLSLVVGIGLGAAATWLGVYWYGDHVQARQIDHLQEQLLQVRTELSGQIIKRDVMEGQLAVETGTRKGLESTLQTTQNKLGAAQDQIAFFEELLPPGPVGAVSIRRFDVQQKGNALNYKVLLMRRGASAKPFVGALQFQAVGHTGDKAVTVLLEPVRVIDDADSTDDESDVPPDVLGLSFERFQNSSGVLEIPEGLVVDAVTLNVLEGKTLRVSRTMNLAAQHPND